jgi:sulfur-oxidizing protein SoxZ
MARKFKIRTRETGDVMQVLVLIGHPMETGMRVDKTTKKKVPAHFIQKMTVAHNGKTVAEADLGIAVSADPLLAFGLNGAKKGDKVKVSWSDNKGESETQEIAVE